MAREIYPDAIWTDKKRIIFGLPLTFTRYFLMKDKLIIQSGWFMVETNEIDLYKIVDKKIITGPIGRMFNYGSLVLYSKDTNHRVFCLKNIKNINETLTLFTEHIDKQRDKYHIRGKDMYGGGYYTKG